VLRTDWIAVDRFVNNVSESGGDALRAMIDVGRPWQWDARGIKWFGAALRQGAQAHAFGTEL